jgi:hypothetical protein
MYKIIFHNVHFFLPVFLIISFKHKFFIFSFIINTKKFKHFLSLIFFIEMITIFFYCSEIILEILCKCVDFKNVDKNEA